MPPMTQLLSPRRPPSQPWRSLFQPWVLIGRPWPDWPRYWSATGLSPVIEASSIPKADNPMSHPDPSLPSTSPSTTTGRLNLLSSLTRTPQAGPWPVTSRPQAGPSSPATSRPQAVLWSSEWLQPAFQLSFAMAGHAPNPRPMPRARPTTPARRMLFNSVLPLNSAGTAPRGTFTMNPHDNSTQSG